MWLELALGALAAVVLVQVVLLWRLRRAVLKARVSYPAEAFTDVPTSMLVVAIERMERRLDALAEVKATPAVVAPVSVPKSEPRILPLPASSVPTNYDLARDMLREGVRADQLVERCGLSRAEAELLCHLHEASERLAADEARAVRAG